MVDRLGPHVVADLDDTERMAKLDAAVTASGWRDLRTASDDGGPWASAVEVAVVAEEMGRGLADVSVPGPDLGGRSAPVDRGAAGDKRPRRSCSHPISPNLLAAVMDACPTVHWSSTVAVLTRRSP